MLLILICIVLAICALYGFGMWLFVTYRLMRRAHIFHEAGMPVPADQWQYATYTFQLGLCAILAAGFLGIILAIGGF